MKQKDKLQSGKAQLADGPNTNTNLRKETAAAWIHKTVNWTKAVNNFKFIFKMFSV